MVALSPRFLFLAALVATSFLDAVALPTPSGDITARHHAEKADRHSKAATDSGKSAPAPVVPLPPSASKGKGKGKAHKGDKHSKSDKRVSRGLVDDDVRRSLIA